MTWRSFGFLLTTISLLAGCGFRTLKADLEQVARRASVEGRSSVRESSGSPVVVVAYTIPAGQVADLFVLPHPGPFFFSLVPGSYRLAAFEDRNRDLAYQPEVEPAVLGDPAELLLAPGDDRRGLDLAIDPGSNVRLPFAVSAASEDRQVNHLPVPQLGKIVDIDDPRFSEANAKLGLWDPLRFLFEVGAGVYFLEEYDPDKIPILFVHGAMGHPGNWKSLVAALDRSRFQPWLVYYPTAPHLDRIAQMLVKVLNTLQVKYGFTQMVVAAHSMGGLVTRAAFNYAVANADGGQVVTVPVFVSISSPWGGHAAAAMGVKHAPVVAPYWEDMAPGSAFLKELPQTPLPAECVHTLFFSYRGTPGLRGEANDGVVALASELSMPIQSQAARVVGFDETHVGILHSPAVAAELNTLLSRVIASESEP